MTILNELKLNRIILSDGAWGTFLQAKGMKPEECPELWNITHMSDLKDIAESYFLAGSDIIETNSFGGSRFKLSQYGFGDRVTELNQAAAAISRFVAGNDKHVAGSIGPTGKMLLMGDVTEEELYDAFCEQAIALESGGADIIIIETMSAVDEASLAVRAARESSGSGFKPLCRLAASPPKEEENILNHWIFSPSGGKLKKGKWIRTKLVQSLQHYLNGPGYNSESPKLPLLSIL